ncbi:hypothetical protein LJR099_003082 [Variovorax paradoxus]|uniref:hypothetical protein n=1 Tax=Variovorax paradoxus TaxID=34073 RepID=UPI00399B2788
MQTQVENLVQTENGPRFVQEGNYRGNGITVATGFDITHDNWPFHVYIKPANGPVIQLSHRPSQYRANSMQSAFNQGMQIAVQHLNPREAVFQTQVK